MKYLVVIVILIVIFRRPIITCIEHIFGMQDDNFPDAFHEECFMCNRGSCIEPIICELIDFKGVTDGQEEII